MAPGFFAGFFERWGMPLFFMALVPWVFLQAQISVPGDMAWLSLGVEKFLSGQRMTEAFHDGNPPMCFLIYAPVALLMQAGMTVWNAALVYTVGLLFIFSGLTAAVLRQGFGFGAPLRAVFMTGYLAPLLFFFHNEFGNKDYLIAAALLPFLLVQLNMNEGRAVHPAVRVAVLVLATPFILAKPHYGLLPVCLLVVRFFRGRTWRVVFDADFIVLAAGVLAYAGVVFVWFDDYVHEILVDIGVKLYAAMVQDIVFPAAAAMAILSACLSVFAFFSNGTAVERKVFLSFAALSLVSVFPFLVQMKGFSLHMIPYFSLMFPALLMGVMLNTRVPALAVVVATIACGYAYTVLSDPLSHDDIRHARLMEYVRENTDEHGFIMQADTTNIVTRLAVYAGVPHATRFPSLWFTAYIDPVADKALVTSYGDMLAEDIEKGRPAFIAVYHDPQLRDDLVAVFGGNPNFRKAWSKYRKTDVVNMNLRDFYKQHRILFTRYAAYDIYKRK